MSTTIKEVVRNIKGVAHKAVSELDGDLTYNKATGRVNDGGDYQGFPINIARCLVQKDKNESGNWLIEAMVMPTVEKHIIFEVDGKLNRQDARGQVMDVICDARFDVTGSVEDMFEDLIVNTFDNKDVKHGVRTIEETQAILGYVETDIYTAHTGGYDGDIDRCSSHDWLKEGSDQFFSIDWNFINEEEDVA